MNSNAVLLFPRSKVPHTSRVRHHHLLIALASGPIVFIRLVGRPPGQTELTEITNILAVCSEDPYLNAQRVNYELDCYGGRLINRPIDDLDIWWGAVVQNETVLDSVLANEGLTRPEVLEKRLDELQCGIREFEAVLNPELVQALRASEGDVIPMSHNWLVDEETRAWRKQAIGSYPIVLPLIRENKSAYRGLTRAIDRGVPLLDNIAKSQCIPQSAIKALRQTSLPVVGLQWARRVPTLLRALACLPANRRPRTAEQWGEFNTTIKLIEESCSIDSAEGQLWLRSSMSGKRGDVPIDAETRGAQGHRIEQLIRMLANALRFTLEFEGYAAALAVEETVRIFRAHQDPFRLANLGERFQRVFAAVFDQFEEERALLLQQRWAGILGQPFESEGFQIRELTTGYALDLEAREMGHCVGTYAVSCLAGRSLIYSIRGPDNQASTLELTLKSQGGDQYRFIVAQHLARRNRQPTPGCVNAVSDLIRHLQRLREDIQRYLQWRGNIAALPISRREEVAFYRPVISTLGQILPKAWAYDTLVERTKALMLGQDRIAKTTSRH